MKKFFRFQLYCICLLWVTVGCEVKKPDDVISESQMEDLLYDYHMAQALADNLPYNESYKKTIYTEAVFRKHNTTEAVFDSSMVWYTRNTQVLSDIYGKVAKRLKLEQDGINHLIAMRDKKPKMTAPGDSIDVWSGSRMVRLTGAALTGRFTFALPADTNFKKRDTLLWEVRYHFLDEKPDTIHAAVMAMQVVYENDSIISQLKRVYESGVQRIRLQSDTLGMIKTVRGFIYYPEDKQRKTLLADKISLMRYHCTDSLSAAARDSLRNDSIGHMKAESVKKKPDMDSVTLPAPHQRLRPEELNKRSDEVRQAKPEQVETEKRIQQERLQMQQERRTHRRNTAPARRNN